MFLTSWRQLTLALVVAWFAAGVASMAVVWSALSLAEPTSVAPVAGLLANQFSPWCAAMGGTPLVTWMLWERPSASGRTGDWVRYPGLAAAWVMLHLWLTQALPSWFQGSPQLFPAWQLSGPRAMTTSVTALVQFALTVGFTWAANNRNHAITQVRLADELSQRESALRADLTTAQLALLRQQLHPHFLFNALNTASSLVDISPGAARTVIARLADLLRTSLRRHEPETTLGDELSFIDLYLDVERARFGDCLHLECHVEEHLLGTTIPTFLLQPLVENAVRHGIAVRPDAGRIRMDVRQMDADVQLTLTNGCLPVTRADADRSTGVGLAQTRKRLAALYGDLAHLSVAADGRASFSVTVRWPQSNAQCTLR